MSEVRGAVMALSFYDEDLLKPIVPDRANFTISQPLQEHAVTAKGLCKLIVVNSYAKGKARVVDVENHTHVAGRNGRGKTTLLRLIPLFYGEQPSRMVKPSGEVLRPIREYMFDSPAAYLVFEYRNHDGVKLAILYYGSGESPSYTLCDGPYDFNLFVENGEFIESRLLNARLKSRFMRNPTPALGVMDYQAIIQGRNDRKKSDLRNHIRRFSLAERQDMSGVEKIASAMFFKDITFNALRRMAYSVVNDDPTQKIATSMSEKGQKTFFENFQTHQNVMRHAQAFRSGSEQHLILGEARRLKRACAVKANLLSEFKSKEAEEFQVSINSIGEALEKERKAHLEQVSQVDARLSLLAGSIKQQDAVVAAVNREESDYAAKSMANAKELVASIPALETTGRELDETLSRLQEKSNSITVKYDRELAKINEAHAVSVNLIRDGLQKHEEQRDQALQVIEIEHDGEKSAEEDVYKAKKEIFDHRSLKAKDDRLQAEKIASGIRQSEEFAEKLSSAEALRDSLHERERGLHDDRAKKQDELNAEKNLRREKNEALSVQEAAREKKHRDLQNLLRMESPDPGSLLYFLRENSADWLDNIGRVIREDLLVQPGLAPGIADGGGASLYGVDIDLSKVKSDVVDREVALSSRIAGLREDISGDAARINALEDEIKAANKRVAALQADYDAALAAIEKTKQAVREAVAAIDNVKRASAEDIRLRLEAANANLAEAKRLETLVEEETRQSERDFSLRMKAISEKFTLRKKAAQEAYTVEKSRVQLLLQQNNKELQQTCDAIRSAMDEELTSGGFDAKALRELQQQVDDRRNKLAQAVELREAVDAYSRWLKTRPQERTRALEILAEKKLALVQDEQKKSQFLAQFEQYREACETRIESFKAKLRVNADYQRNLSAFRAKHATEHYGLHLDEEVIPAGLSFEKIASDFAGAAQTIAEATAKRNRILNPIHTLFKRAPEGTYIADFSRQMPDAFADAEGSSTVEDIISQLSNWYGAAHVQSLEAINAQCQTACGVFASYLDTLMGFRSKMDGLSRQLQNSLNSEMSFDAIKNVTLRISANVQRVPYWSDLNGLVTEFKRWVQDGLSGAPPAALINNMSALTAYLNNGRLEEHPENLIDMEILVDDGTLKRVSNEADLKNVSSNGLSNLVMCMIFVAFVNRVRKEEDIWLTWALDEIAAIDPGNSKALLQMLDYHKIRLVSASPSGEESVLTLFKNHYEIKPNFEIQTCLLSKRRTQHVS